MRLLFTFTLFLLFNNLFAQTTFTSTQAGAWDDGATWGNTSPGVEGTDYPGRNDHAIIGHTVTVNNTADNNTGGGRRPDRLAQNENIIGVCGCTTAGATTGCQTTSPDGCDVTSFYHAGEITVNNSGTFSSNVNVILGDTVVVNNGGTFELTVNTNDVFVLSQLSVLSGGEISIGDNVSLSADGVLNTESGATSTIGDDLFFDGDNGVLCGDGQVDVDKTALPGAGTNSIRLVNNTDTNLLDQICANSTVVCDGDCCGADCTTDLDVVAGVDGIITPDEDNGTARPETLEEALPIELAYFKTYVKENEVFVAWGTYAEIDNDFFTIEKSTNNIVWEEIGIIDGQGNSNIITHYKFNDTQSSNGTSYYRVKQTDFDGKFSYTPISIISIGKDSFSLSPNPNNGNFYIYSSTDILVEDVSIFDLAGNRIPFVSNQVGPKVNVQLKETEPGLYFVNIIKGSNQIIEKLVVK